jgi:DNA-binding Xre family transcriptional regulator
METIKELQKIKGIRKRKEIKKKKISKPRGRKPKIVQETKIRQILEIRKMSRKDLQELIRKKDAENPISPDALSRIVNGSRMDYKLSTVYRLCRALDVTPNQLLNWEEEVISGSTSESK